MYSIFHTVFLKNILWKIQGMYHKFSDLPYIHNKKSVKNKVYIV
ncbi:hypothetical protein bcere0004_52850 [Bacillus cereus BGSC 6E1]|nr:hypothetical protein bcere0004_52850 [Bacillus cereus BGSC 6E1]